MKVIHFALGIGLVLSLPARSVFADEPQDEPRYVSVKKCKVCHATDDIGNQYKIWKSSLHAQAYQTLLGEESKKIAQERGIKLLPNEAPECLQCHVTGYGKDSSRFEFPVVKEDGVQCESCHGPGSEYKKIDTMLDKNKAIAAGLI
ncbi:MAG: cytochrome c family protein, partial [Fidelibacterota bacterium]